MKKLRDLFLVFVVLGLSSTVLQAQIATYNASGNLVIIAPIPLEAAGLDIISFEGLLEPVPDGDAFGFTFLLSNTNFQVTAGNLGTTTTLSGVVELPVVYNRTPGVRPAQDLLISWGNGPTPVEIPVVPPLLLLLSGPEFDFLLE